MLTKIWTFLRGDLLHVSQGGKHGKITRRWSVRRIVEIVCLLAIMLGGVYLLWSSKDTIKFWFDQRWQPRLIFAPATQAVLPLDSELQSQLVAWMNLHARRTLKTEFATMIVQETFTEAVKHNVDPFLVLAIMQVESNFDYTARSTAGAIGLMQVIPRWHPDKLAQPQHVFDPRQNIRVGTEVIAEYRDRHAGDMRKALLQYNGSLHIPGGDYANKVVSARRNLVGWLETQFAKN